MKSFTEYLEEKRAHAKQNPKITPWEMVSKYIDDPDVMLHWTQVAKIGIKPLQEWSTPAGIYGWSMRYYAPKLKKSAEAIGGDPDDWKKLVNLYVANLTILNNTLTNLFTGQALIAMAEKWSANKKKMTFLDFVMSDEMEAVPEIKRAMKRFEQKLSIISDGLKKSQRFRELMKTELKVSNRRELNALVNHILVGKTEDIPNFKPPVPTTLKSNPSVDALNLDIVVRGLEGSNLAYVGQQQRDPFSAFEYGPGKKFLYVLKPKGGLNILDLDKTYNISENDVMKMMVGLFKYIGNTDQKVIERLMTSLVKYATYTTVRGTEFYYFKEIESGDGYRIYDAVKHIAIYAATLSRTEDGAKYIEHSRQPVLLSKAFRLLGFDGVADYSSDRIFSEEPGQLMIFETKNVQVLDMIHFLKQSSRPQW